MHTRNSTTATQAETLARLLNGEPNAREGQPLAQAERVAAAVKNGRQKAIAWLYQILDDGRVTSEVLLALRFDRLVVVAADTLVVRPRESVLEHAQRVAACHDADVLAVAVSVIEDEMRQRVEDPRETRAASYTEARRVLQRAADGLANERSGDRPPAGGTVDNLPTAPGLRTALLALADHTEGAQAAMGEMLHGPGNQNWGVVERLSPADTELLLSMLHNLLQVVGMMVIDVTAAPWTEETYEDRMTLVECETKQVSRVEGMATIAEMTARRLRTAFNKAHSEEDGEEGQVH